MTDPKLSSRRTDAMPEPAAHFPEGTGAVSDAVIRRIGASLLAGDTPGIAIIMGSADCAAHVSLLTGIYSDMGLTVFAIGETGTDGRPGCISVGAGCAGLQNALQALKSMAEIFCGVSSEGGTEQLKQGLARLSAFINAPEHPEAEAETLLQTAEALGIPVLRELGRSAEPAALARRAMEAGNIHLKPKPLSLPVGYDSAFEGERVRDSDCAVEFFPACELVTAADLRTAEDHCFSLIGPDFPEMSDGIYYSPLAIFVEVGGEKMQADFAPVIQNRIHSFFNYAEGVEHQGQQNALRIRLSSESLKKGLTLSGLAEALYVGIRREFEPIAERCRITFITDPAAAESFLNNTALPMYHERAQRLAALTDENVERFFSCTTCQSIAPRHCCVVTPERCGMCGALTWPDAAAAYELMPTGPNRPIEKGQVRDEHLGSFDAVDCAVAAATGGAVQHLSLYSLTENPMTGCGRLECICCVEPVSGGVVIVDRDYPGMTPVGMSFEELASMVFPGEQNPGFMGVARQYISSKKFLLADGGALRIVWMPRELKENVSARLNQTVRDLYGIENYSDMIGDETISSDPETLYAFLTEKGHPVLQMEPIM